jgi:hypothetical protein
MHEYVLTEQEKAMIKKYLETGEKLETVNADLELIKQFLSKVEEQKP